MADFEIKKIELSKINGGVKFKDGDGIGADDINAPIEASAYAQALATNPPDISEVNNTGTPSVSIEDNDGTPRFKFSNLKGKNGEGVETMFEKTYSTNLLDLSQVEHGKYVVNGALYDSASYCTSGFIPCKAGDTIRLQYNQANVRYDAETSSYTTMRFVEAYDSEKNFITGSNGANAKFYVCPENTAFVRITLFADVCNGTNGFSDTAIVIGDTATILPYEEYSEKLVLKAEYNNDEHIKKIAREVVDLYLPKNIYCAVGRTIELYNKQVCLQAEKYYLRWDCTIGKALSRKFSVTGFQSQIGTYPLSLTVYNGNMEIVGYAETALKIVKGTISNNYSVCPIGDSLTNNKNWIPEIMNLSSGKISFVGTYNGEMKDANGAWQKHKHEGRSGFSANEYLTATVYSYGGEATPHAFWNGSRFDWLYYKNNSGVNPNCVQIFLGTNSLVDDNTANAEQIKQMVDYIRQDDATIPIFVVNTLYKGNQNGIGVQQSNDGYASLKGVFKFHEDKKVMDLMKRLDTALDGYSSVYMINLALTHDSEYNFGSVETAVNPRASQTELMPVESVHPQPQGYFQMADYIYSVYCGVLI